MCSKALWCSTTRRSGSLMIARFVVSNRQWADNLLQNGTFKSEFDVRNSCFGRSIWICCLQICICGGCFVVSLDVAVFATIPISLRGFLSWKVTDIGYCMLFCAFWKRVSIWKCCQSLYIPSSEVFWVGWICLKPFWKRLRLFRKVLNYGFCMWQFELVHLFVDRSLRLRPKILWAFSQVMSEAITWRKGPLRLVLRIEMATDGRKTHL